MDMDYQKHEENYWISSEEDGSFQFLFPSMMNEEWPSHLFIKS